MTDVTVTVVDDAYEFEFDNAPTEQEIESAMATIGGRKKRR